MAANVPSSDPLSLDPDDELTRPESRPALRAAHSVDAVETPGLLGSAAALPGDEEPAAADADENADAVTLVDARRGRLVNVETLPPPDFPDLDLEKL